MRRLELAGRRFGRLLVMEDVGSDKYSHRIWSCRCDCGETVETRGDCLTGEQTHSCGCLCRERVSEANTKHGMISTPEYKTWAGMVERVTDANCKDYPNYGARGITICDEWRDSFVAFYADMGSKPSLQHSIDRTDNNGPYSPDNCRWATRKEQQRNTRSNHNLTYRGRTLCIAAWAEELNMPRSTLYNRIYRGWSTEKALAP